MSDVNQAFLRAYVKSRSAGETIQSLGESSSAGSQPLHARQEDVQRRVDSPVSHAASVRPSAAETPASTKTTPMKTGVWSALGVERGVKAAVVTQTPPAVVRNAVTAVPVDATQVRTRPTPPTEPSGVPPAPKSPSLEALNQAWTKKRAPSLNDLQPKSPPSPASKAGPAPAPPTSEPLSRQSRTDAPASHRMPGPHAIPSAEKRGPYADHRAPATEHRAPATEHRSVDKEQLQKLPLPVAFTPSWEVDSFSWPEVIVRLEQTDPGMFRRVGHHLADANQTGLRVLAVTSGERGVGRSTVAMHLARAAACAGLKVALVDADAANPSLIDQLRLDVQNGWQDCLFEAVPLEEASVHAIKDEITLFPLTDVVSPQQLHANLHRMSKLIRRISSAFDLVILDSGRLHLDQRQLIGVSGERAIDAAIVVYDTELSIKEKMDSAISILQSLGLNSIGMVENFRS